MKDSIDLKTGHLLKANSFRKFLYAVDFKGNYNLAIMAAFYSALHFASAYLTTKGKFRIDNHPQMIRLVAIYIPKIPKDYSELFQDGWLARYNVYFKPPLETFSKHRDTHLFNIESHINSLLK